MKPKILLIPDRPRWAYESIARGIMSGLDGEYDFEIRYAGDIESVNKNHERWDLIVSLGWKWITRDITTPREKTVATIQSYRTLEGESLDSRAQYLNEKYCAVGVCNSEILHMLHGKVPNLFLTMSGVNVKKFSPNYKAGKNTMVLGWAGHRAQAEFRGLGLIVEAAEKAGWSLIVQDADQKKLPPDDMPGFYHALDCYINASESEGGSLTALEACACGLPLLATETGLAPKLIVEGKTGYIIERDVDSIVGALEKLNKVQCRVLGVNMRNRILDGWTWRERSENYRRLIERGLNYE